MTVDPSGDSARAARAARDLTDFPVIHIDVPTAADALEEINRGDYRLVIAADVLDDGISGIDLFRAIYEVQPHTALVLIADRDSLSDLPEDSATFATLPRPLDAQAFLRVFLAGLEGGDLRAAHAPPVPRARAGNGDLGVIPPLDLKLAQRLIDALMIDVGAMAVILGTRAGDILLERGGTRDLDHDGLTNALTPMVHTLLDMAQVVGAGEISSLQFFDGETYDVFVLSIGIHHFLCLVFDGHFGIRQFGAVNRFGRRTAEDLTALLGVSAFTLYPPAPAQPDFTDATIDPSLDEPLEALVENAPDWDALPAPSEPESVRLEPLQNFDPAILDAGSIDVSLADELFSMDKLAEIANETRRGRGPLSYDEARELGIIP
jgi:hypothetical protein